LSDKTELLQKLRLDRDQTAPRRRTLWAWALAALLLLGGGAAAFLVLRGSAPIAVTYAVARSPDSPSAASALDASGYVVARRQATVAAKITARVTEILIEEGMRVKEGQIMARLDDSNIHAALVQAQAQLAQAEANLAAARIAFDDEKPIYRRSLELHDKGWVSGSDYDGERAKYDEAEQQVKVSERALAVAKAALVVAERNQEDTLVRAPYDGIITVKAAQPGEVVSPLSAGGGFTRTGIGTLVDMDSLEVEVDVSENFIERARPGQDAVVRLNAYPDWQIPAYVIAIIPTADRAKATVKVRVGFKEKDPRILPEMGARVAFLAKERKEANGQPAAGVLIPAAAVLAGDKPAVFVISGDRVQKRFVALGARRERDQMVLQGLAVGETVAAGDLAKLGDGAQVKRSAN
jgi:RND family efflux transporter MFP subunit